MIQVYLVVHACLYDLRKMTENIIAVGIDCASDKHQYHIQTKEKQALKGQIGNNLKDGEKLIKLINNYANKYQKVIIGLEATGTYHIALKHYLEQHNFEVIVINPMKTSAYSKIDNYGNKTDPIDASGICNFILDGKYKTCKQMNNKYMKLREMCRALLLLQADATKLRTRMHTRLAIINPEYNQYFSSDNFCVSNLWLLEEYLLPSKISLLDQEYLQKYLTKISNGFGKQKTAEKIISLAKNSFGVTKNIEGYECYFRIFLDLYRFYSKKIKELKKEIEEESLKDYCKIEVDYIASIRGISRILAVSILSEIGDINNFEKKSSIINFAGMIVLQKQSGNFHGREKMSKQGSSYLRCYLYQAAMGVRLHSPAFAAVFMNRMNKFQGLNREALRIGKKKVMANLARRVLEAVFICLKKGRKFDEKVAFESINIDEFVRDIIASNFAQILAMASKDS
jgi:transposase